MLHGTADPRRPSSWTPLRSQLSPEYIDWCLGILGKHYRFITLEDAVDILEGKKPPVDYGLVLTFDDGYRSNIEDGLPVCRRHGAPMTVFITVSNVEDRKPMWVDRIDYSLQFKAGEARVFNINGKVFDFQSSDRDELRCVYARFRQTIKEKLTDEKEFVSKIDEIAEHLERSSGKKLADIFEEDPWSAILRWDEIVKVQSKEVSFGSHTIDHFRVANLQRDMLEYQFKKSKAMIEEQTRSLCKYIAFPDDSYSVAAAQIARECGYRAAVTTNEGLNRIGSDVMLLKRFSLPVTSDPAKLLADISGFSKAVLKLFNSANKQPMNN